MKKNNLLSILIVIFTFVNVNGQLTAPFTESFNSTTFPSTWNLAAKTGGPWEISGSMYSSAVTILDHTGTAGSTRAWIDFSGADDSVLMVSDTIDVSALTVPELSFWFNNNSSGSSIFPYNILFVEVQDALGNWITLSTLQQENAGVWSEHRILLTSYVIANKVVVRFRAESGGSFVDFAQDLAIDDISVKEYTACAAPVSLNAYGIKDTSAIASWTAGSSSDSAWEIEYGTFGFVLGSGINTGVSVDSLVINSLVASTQYSFYVRGYCTGGDTSSWSGPHDFTTLCSAVSPTYTEDFTTMTNLSAPSCWREAQGNLTVNSSLTFSSSNWELGQFSNAPGGSNSARIRIFGSSINDWLVSPSIDLGSGSTPYQVEFDMAYTYNMQNSPSVNGLGDDDRITFLISTDDGITWSDTNILFLWDSSTNTPAYRGEYFSVNLTAAGYTGRVKFAFYTESTVYNEINELFVDNFSVVPVPSCPKPLHLTFDSATQTSTSLSWTSSSASSISLIEYGAVGFTLGSGTTTTSLSNIKTISGLSHSSCYDVYMRSVCSAGDTTAWIGPIKSCTECAPVVDLCENFDSYSFGESALCWTNFISSTSPLAKVIVSNANAFSGSNSLYATNHNDLSASIIVSSPEMTAVGLGTHRANFWLQGDGSLIVGAMVDPLIPSTFHPIDTITPTSAFQNYKVNFDSYTGAGKFVSFLWQPSSTFDNYYLDEFCFEAIPSCEKAPSVSILNEGQDSNFIRLGWSSDTAHSSYMTAYGPAGFDPISNPAGGDTLVSTITLQNVNGLQPLTEYCFWVKAICNNGDSSLWSGPFCGFTGCPNSTSLPYSQDFSSYSSNYPDGLPQCWEEATGKLLSGSSVVFLSNSDWRVDGFGNVGTTGSARINLYSAQNEWLISPTFDLGADPSHTKIIEFDIALTDYATTSAGIIGDDDTLALLISYDNGVTWNHSGILELWDSSTISPSVTGDHVLHQLKNKTGLVKFAFYAGASLGVESNEWFIDNFSIRDTVYVGLEEHVVELANYTIFPNPNTGVFTIQNIGAANKSSITVVDVQGRFVYEDNVYFSEKGKRTIDINHLNSGVYVLLIQSDGKIEQHRVIINK